ncbi:hypothetical protein K493DRAFT_370642 [Basidiobolus meristosporus CBS 931.73]|uniref:Uncharacterized protein n=1 Tax=Basidiobolus meristosporus CBS 931.73 TaxID=1314790 RepID=A0A1Y1YFF4_9FUNG|nr:hypothetical protein K493DRAFT_370642 [Basidiobolus meristosporus CBS 931.73]|eukprot:ORX96705.1 hypothetical protein K493DRAFT_370642 [Basidiobolus meristosporus CBS 931.73]
MFSFLNAGCHPDLLKRLSKNPSKGSTTPLLRQQKLTDNASLNSDVSTGFQAPKKPYTVAGDFVYSDDLNGARMKLKEVVFDDAIALGFPGDTNSPRFDTLKFTLTPKLVR